MMTKDPNEDFSQKSVQMITETVIILILIIVLLYLVQNDKKSNSMPEKFWPLPQRLMQPPQTTSRTPRVTCPAPKKEACQFVAKASNEVGSNFAPACDVKYVDVLYRH